MAADGDGLRWISWRWNRFDNVDGLEWSRLWVGPRGWVRNPHRNLVASWLMRTSRRMPSRWSGDQFRGCGPRSRLSDATGRPIRFRRIIWSLHPPLLVLHPTDSPSWTRTTAPAPTTLTASTSTRKSSTSRFRADWPVPEEAPSPEPPARISSATWKSSARKIRPEF